MDGFLQNPQFQIKLSELLDQDWFKIGISLKVEEHSLKSIKSDFANFPKQEDKAYEMIKKWFNFDKNPTFEKLKHAILDIPKHDLLMEVEDLAKISSLPNKDSTVSSNKGLLFSATKFDSSQEKDDDKS
nr:uncharacterized protein LOC105849483 isoform X4 [Hydra vulgaris]